MSNYVQTTFFTPKDTLPTTNPAKTIFGAAYDVEFGNIASAIQSKYDNTTTAPSLLSLTVGTPTGGNLGAGSINAQSIFVNNVAVVLAGGAVTSITGTANQIAASASTGAVTLSLSPNVVIPAPASSNGLTINATTGQVGQLLLQGFSSGAGTLEINISRTSSTNTIGGGPGIQLNDGTVANTFAIQSGAGSLGIWAFGTGGWVEGTTFGKNGNVVINAPSSGITLAVTGGGGGATISTSGLSSANQIQDVLISRSSSASIIQEGPNITFSDGTTANLVALQDSLGSFQIWNFGSSSWQTRVTVAPDGGLFMQGATGSSQGQGTINATGLFVNGVSVGGTTGTFTAGTTGLSGATATGKWTKVGTSVTLYMGQPSTIVSNATTFTLTGLPGAITPATAKFTACPASFLNNSTLQNNFAAQVTASGTITFYVGGTSTGFTAVNNKSWGDGTANGGAVFVYDMS
jgi:hypothetical protein